MATDDVPLAWLRFLRTHSEITRTLDAALRERFDISLREYEVLITLQDAPERRMRRVDLAAAAVLSQSGVTRMLAPLERRGLIGNVPCENDGRVTYAYLDKAGEQLLRKARPAHRADVRRLFTEHFSADELDELSDLLGRLPGGDQAAAWAGREEPARSR